MTREPFVRRSRGRQRVAVALALFALVFPAVARAQGDGARFYWKGLTGATFVPVIYNSKSGNSNPFDPAHTVLGDSNFDASLMMAGFGRALAVSDRAASVSVLFPMGSLSGQAVVNGKAATLSAGGFGDPMLQFGLNFVGPKAIKNIPDVLRYEPGFSVDVIGSLAVPIGEYNSDQPLNIG
ncbi:MAG: transporter, partial [Rhodospirillaceae bacterium]